MQRISEILPDVARSLEYSLRITGLRYLERGEPTPEWIWEELEYYLRAQGILE